MAHPEGSVHRCQGHYKTFRQGTWRPARDNPEFKLKQAVVLLLDWLWRLFAALCDCFLSYKYVCAVVLQRDN